MDNQNKNEKSTKIDEELMMNIMVDGVKKEGLVPPVESNVIIQETEKANNEHPENPEKKDKKQPKRSVEINYESIFLKKTDTNARDGKAVYIRPAFHEKLTRILQVIGDDKVSIYAYLDNLLDHHFNEFSEQINKSYNDKYKPI